ncbi:DUF1310 family protein [Alloscardovia theropitheci]|uniref:DUF1310 family protein n=1 Tax=Alloscardovia theropitheci TaxID=2496842 RepID=A0A4R0QYE4_9BIFI|nr:DUF1310 family protein [Alloscardovia theropitheci]TCD54621.1 DUF1310 family protein [Alloscardovia theropitheci]TCD54887.1 DUF1310 family protein [Alloscardovia theropitheci]
MRRFGLWAKKHWELCILIVSIVVSVGVIGGGVVYIRYQQNQEREYMYSVVMGSEGRKLIEDELRSADPNALTDKGRIKSYRILTDTIEHNPMGGIMVNVELNSDAELEIGLAFEKNNPEEELTVRITDLSGKAADLFHQLGA